MWWGGSEEHGKKVKRAAPIIEGPTGVMCTANQAKTQWALAVLDKVEPNHKHTPGSSKWERLRRTILPAARALLQELGA